MNRSRIVYIPRHGATQEAELNALAACYRFILLESSGPSKKLAEPVREPSSRDAAVIVRNEKGGNYVGRDEVTKVLRNEAEGEEMPKLTYEEMDYEPMDIGSYEGVFTRYEEDEMEHGPVYKLFFRVMNDEEYEGKELSRLVSQKFNPKSNLFQTVQGLLGRPIRSGEEVELDELVGRPCVLNIGHNVKERGTFEKIDGVNPARKRKSKPRLEIGEAGQEDDELEAAPF
jgi:hypothetical protein